MPFLCSGDWEFHIVTPSNDLFAAKINDQITTLKKIPLVVFTWIQRQSI